MSTSRTTKLPVVLVALVLVLVVLVALVLGVRSCRKTGPVPEPPAESAAEFTQRLIRERNADPVYSNGLVTLAARQSELGRLKNEALREFEAWRVGFLSSNEEARAVFDQIQSLVKEGVAPTNAAFAELAGKFEGLVAADPGGKYLLGKRDAIEAAISEHQATIADFIGGYARKQRLAHAGEAAAAAQRLREQRIAEGKIKPRPEPERKFPEPRKAGWATNQPPSVAVPPASPPPASPASGTPASGAQKPKRGTWNPASK